MVLRWVRRGEGRRFAGWSPTGLPVGHVGDAYAIAGIEGPRQWHAALHIEGQRGEVDVGWFDSAQEAMAAVDAAWERFDDVKSRQSHVRNRKLR